MALLFLPGSFCIAFLLAFGMNWLALIPWRRSAGRHWTERARLLYPVRISARLNNWLILLGFALLGSIFVPQINFFLIGLTGFSGALLAGFFFNREIFPSLQFGLWLRTIIAFFFVFLVWLFALLFGVFEMPENFGPKTWLIACGIFLLSLALLLGLGILISKWLRVLLPATEALKTLVAEVSQKMQVPVRATWILPTYFSNAAAFPQTRQLIFTDKLLATLSDEEIKTVCAHELGHLSEPRKVLMARAVAWFSFYPMIFARPLSSLGNSGNNAFWALLPVCFCLWLIGIIVARRMEKRADKMAVENQSEAAAYARALARIYEANQMPAVMPRRSVKIHPDLYDRMSAAGVTPDFPKPLPAKKNSWTSYLTCTPLVLIFLFAFGAPYFIHSGPSKRMGILNRLYQIEVAKETWASEHNITNSLQLNRELTPQDLAPYLPPEFTQKDFGNPVYGEVYSIGHLNGFAEAQLTQDLKEYGTFGTTLPKGTIIKLGTNGEGQYFLPSQQSTASDNIPGQN